jgi:hypothetical protein
MRGKVCKLATVNQRRASPSAVAPGNPANWAISRRRVRWDMGEERVRIFSVRRACYTARGPE